MDHYQHHSGRAPGQQATGSRLQRRRRPRQVQYSHFSENNVSFDPEQVPRIPTSLSPSTNESNAGNRTATNMPLIEELRRLREQLARIEAKVDNMSQENRQGFENVVKEQRVWAEDLKRTMERAMTSFDQDEVLDPTLLQF